MLTSSVPAKVSTHADIIFVAATPRSNGSRTASSIDAGVSTHAIIAWIAALIRLNARESASSLDASSSTDTNINMPTDITFANRVWCYVLANAIYARVSTEAFVAVTPAIPTLANLVRVTAGASVGAAVLISDAAPWDPSPIT